jgi:hypothetical protein
MATRPQDGYEAATKYHYQPEDVLNAVQVMRRRALAARTLIDTPQQRYVDQDGTILIEPVNPDEVYVPEYNPGVIYGAPEPVYPGYSTGEMIGAGVLAFGAGGRGGYAREQGLGMASLEYRLAPP